MECALKARIAKDTQRHDFPPRDAPQLYSHDLGLLLARAKLPDLKSQPSELRGNWNIVKEGSEQSRYQLASEIDAGKLLDAVKDRRHGVLPWIKRHW